VRQLRIGPRPFMAPAKSPPPRVALIRPVSLPDKKRADTTLGDVAAMVAELKIRPPVVFVVGEVATLGAGWVWFEKRPLFGRRILVTRPAQQADDLVRPLAGLGAEGLLQPAVEIRPLKRTEWP